MLTPVYRCLECEKYHVGKVENSIEESANCPHCGSSNNRMVSRMLDEDSPVKTGDEEEKILGWVAQDDDISLPCRYCASKVRVYVKQHPDIKAYWSRVQCVVCDTASPCGVSADKDDSIKQALGYWATQRDLKSCVDCDKMIVVEGCCHADEV